ncbi:MAG: hypothetical protein H7X99_09385 [Saprospiraceae bacterium]|nr:hypothetical protein [Saprospiraceae bacterium]
MSKSPKLTNVAQVTAFYNNLDYPLKDMMMTLHSIIIGTDLIYCINININL